MRRKKHKNDTKANTHWERKVRATGRTCGRFKHSDYRIESKMWVDNRWRRMINREVDKEMEEYYE